jgi:hypothetical protein
LLCWLERSQCTPRAADTMALTTKLLPDNETPSRDDSREWGGQSKGFALRLYLGIEHWLESSLRM